MIVTVIEIYFIYSYIVFKEFIQVLQQYICGGLTAVLHIVRETNVLRKRQRAAEVILS